MKGKASGRGSRAGQVQLAAALTAGLLALPGGAAAEPATSVPVPTGGGDAQDGGGLTVLSRSSLLWSSPAWQRLKLLWRRLDEVKPGPDGYGNYDLIYPDSMDSWRQDARLAIQDLREEAPSLGIDTLELDILSRLVDHRIQLLCWGTMMPMTRMMPPPVTGQLDDITVTIEERIDSIRDLREQGVLDSEEMRQAFTLLAGSVESYAMLGAVNTGTGYTGLLYFEYWPTETDRILAAADSMGSTEIARVEREGESYEGQLAELVESFETLRTSLRATRDRVPALVALLRDLELFEPDAVHTRTEL